MQILVVDDERQITRVLRASLQSSGYEVVLAHDGLEALEIFRHHPPDLVITDLAMPGMDGVELTREIRRVSEIPVLVLSVRNGEQQKIAALDHGADDYLTKPFSMPELLARVRVQLRRAARHDPAPKRIDVGDFSIDTEAHLVRVRGEEIHLTPKEFDLLFLLAQHIGRVLPHKTILRAVWGPAGEDQPEYLRVLVAQLRKKIEPRAEPRYIQSEPWVGYRFVPELDEPS